MKTNSKLLKSALICVIIGFFSTSAFSQAISAIGDFGNANMAGLSQVICSGKSVDLSVPTDPNITYKWLTRHPSTDGTTAGAGTNLPTNTGTISDAAANLTTAGYYIYKLQATNNSTSCAEVFEQLVYVLPTPTVTITAPSDVLACESQTENIIFQASGASTPSVTQTFAITYQWYSQKQGGGAETLISGATSSSYTVATPTGPTSTGIYDYFVKVKYVIKDCGETLSDKKTVEVQASPTKPAITIASN